MRLDLVQSGPVETSYEGDAVRVGASLELDEPVELGIVPGDDHLADLAVLQVVLFAVLLQQADAPAAQHGLHGAGRVVDAAVHDPGVVPGLVGGRRLLRVEDDHVASGGGQPSSHGQAEDAGPDHDDALPPARLHSRILCVDAPTWSRYG